MAKALTELMAPIQEAFKASKEWQDTAERAYPPEKKKEKKVKNRGTKFPGYQKEQAAATQEIKEAVQDGGAAVKDGDSAALPDRTVEK